MSGIETIFRPGRNRNPNEYWAWFNAQNATVYPGDWMEMSGSDPLTEGPLGNGILEGEQLLSTDYGVCCKLAQDGFEGTIGVNLGRSVSGVQNWGDVRAHGVLTDELCVILRSGVALQSRVSLVGLAFNYLAVGPNGVAVSIATEPGSANYLGVQRTVGSAYSRVAAGDAIGCVAFVRCGR